MSGALFPNGHMKNERFNLLIYILIIEMCVRLNQFFSGPRGAPAKPDMVLELARPKDGSNGPFFQIFCITAQRQVPLLALNIYMIVVARD